MFHISYKTRRVTVSRPLTLQSGPRLRLARSEPHHEGKAQPRHLRRWSSVFPPLSAWGICAFSSNMLTTLEQLAVRRTIRRRPNLALLARCVQLSRRRRQAPAMRGRTAAPRPAVSLLRAARSRPHARGAVHSPPAWHRGAHRGRPAVERYIQRRVAELSMISSVAQQTHCTKLPILSGLRSKWIFGEGFF